MKAIVHTFKINGKNLVLDVNSNCVHEFDDESFVILRKILELKTEKLISEPPQKIYNNLNISMVKINEIYLEIYNLYKKGMLFSTFEHQFKIKPKSHLKSLCLNVTNNCNMKCEYCFANGGNYEFQNNDLGMSMTSEVAKNSIDFLLENSGDIKNLDIDFFGGEPLINLKVIKFTIKYAKEKAAKFNKNIKFTLTTNAKFINEKDIKYLNEKMENIVFSLDGRKETNDAVRKDTNGNGTYDVVIQNIKNTIATRGNKEHYVRATFTRFNKKFLDDIKHMLELGFNKLAIEPVVLDKSSDLSIREKDLEEILFEYENLAIFYVKEKKRNPDFDFFRFLIDFDKSPCLVKRIMGCGVGREYVAIVPNGDIYPCHQLIKKELRLGNVKTGFDAVNLLEKFKNNTLFQKPKCKGCFAKFYCCGGCSANAYNINGNFNIPHNISCQIQKKRIECALYVKSFLR